MPAFLEAGPLKARRTDPRSVPLDDTMWIASISSAEGMARVSHRFRLLRGRFSSSRVARNRRLPQGLDE